jgi:hypothetical protein
LQGRKRVHQRKNSKRRKQVKVHISRQTFLVEKASSKTMGIYGLQWELNEQALAEASKTDGVFPLITNTHFPPVKY